MASDQTEEMDVVCIWIGQMGGDFNKTDVGLDWQSGERHNDTHCRPRGATYHMSARPEASGPSGS
jgi:hypothetical protein